MSLVINFFLAAKDAVSYVFLLGYYTWMMVPCFALFYIGYKYFVFYSSTSVDNYNHTKLQGESAQKTVQAAIETIDWLASVLNTLLMIRLANAMIRIRFGISVRPRAPPPPQQDRTLSVQETMAQSIRTLGNVVASNPPKSHAVHAPLSFKPLIRDPVATEPSEQESDKTE